ncbi:hypothetical protein [Actinacidiphila acididurans]|uniref:Uncharacterized protein n=1 Tax=Actinacidiphila acididurans TaxID=2784346 RepID=A0ABS2TXJ9_9ACTN|nr:hypothetical protein [Actinacidiphila acididurans]MBM9506678.1 hypothetical protein [Actinacidiphila acididurans]
MEELFLHFRAAGRPRLPRIVAAIAALPDAPRASRETVRRLLKGETISQWQTVDALLQALSAMANQDPDRQRTDDYDDETTYRSYLRQLWNNDIDGVEEETAALEMDDPWATSQVTPPRRPGGYAPPSDPWATSQSKPTAPTQTYSDEPPF